MDSTPIPNPFADTLREKYGQQLDAVLSYVACSSDGPSGLAGSVHERTARDQECKLVLVKVGAGFFVDVTLNIAQQVIKGLEKQAAILDEDAEQLRAAVAAGKFAR